MGGIDSIDDKFKRVTAPLSPEEIKSRDKSAFVHSPDQAREVIKEKNLKFPILVIPQGEHLMVDSYVANDEGELEKAVQSAIEEGTYGGVHLISRYPDKLKSGRRPSEAGLK